ncbi:unnamed protein product, partial [Ascophyllum nodosum]
VFRVRGETCRLSSIKDVRPDREGHLRGGLQETQKLSTKAIVGGPKPLSQLLNFFWNEVTHHSCGVGEDGP